MGDVLPVDEDAALVHIVEAQEQVHEGGLARARAADETDAFARRDGQVQPFDHAAGRRMVVLAPVIGEGHVLEAHFAARHGQRHRVVAVAHVAGAGDRLDAVLHGADILEQR